MGSQGAMFGMQAAGSGVSAINQYQASKSEQEYNENIYDMNSQIANIRAGDALKRGHEEAHIINKQTKLVVGSQRVSFATQGVDVGTGTPASIQDESRAVGAIDALKAKNNAYLEAWGHQVEASNLQFAKKIAASEGKFKRRQIIISGLTGAASQSSSAISASKQHFADKKVAATAKSGGK